MKNTLSHTYSALTAGVNMKRQTDTLEWADRKMQTRETALKKGQQINIWTATHTGQIRQTFYIKQDVWNTFHAKCFSQKHESKKARPFLKTLQNEPQRTRYNYFQLHKKHLLPTVGPYQPG